MYQACGIIPDFQWKICMQVSGWRLVEFFQTNSHSVICFIGSVSSKYLSIVFMNKCGVIKYNDMWYITLSHDIIFSQCMPQHLAVISMSISLSALIISSSLGKVLIIASKNSCRGIVSIFSSNFGSFSWHTSFEIQHTRCPNVVRHALFECNSWLHVF